MKIQPKYDEIFVYFIYKCIVHYLGVYVCYLQRTVNGNVWFVPA